MPKRAAISGKSSAVFFGISSATGLLALSVTSVITLGWMAGFSRLVTIINLFLAVIFAVIYHLLTIQWRKSGRKKEQLIFTIAYFSAFLLEIGAISLYLHFHDFAYVFGSNTNHIIKLQSSSLLVIGLMQFVLLAPALIKAMIEFFRSLKD